MRKITWWGPQISLASRSATFASVAQNAAPKSRSKTKSQGQFLKKPKFKLSDLYADFDQ